jgi:hypothetical protein
MPDEIVMRHRLPHFAHIFASDGYSAGYYSYLWADTLTADAAEAFHEAGGLYDRDTARGCWIRILLAATPAIRPNPTGVPRPRRHGDRRPDARPQTKVYGFEVQGDILQEELVGFELKKNVSIHYQEPALLESIALAAARSQIFDLIKVDYIVKDIQRVQEKLMEEAATVAQSKISRYEKLLGIKLQPPAQVYAEKSAIYYPTQMYDSYTAYESEAIRGGPDRQRYTVRSARKSRTFFFNGLSADGFDAVINPVVTEPVVLFLGPVFVREAWTSPRRPNLYVIRAVYVVVLFVLMCTAWLVLAGTQTIRNVGDMARFGSILFQILAPLQLAVMVFLAAMVAASAVSQEKDRRTLILLLMTRMSNLELVVGKLSASLLQVLMMWAAALPVFLMLTLFGGVSFAQVVRVFAVTLMTVLAAGSLGSTIALWREKTFQTLAMTALILVLWIGLWEAVAIALPDLTLAGLSFRDVAGGAESGTGHSVGVPASVHFDRHRQFVAGRRRPVSAGFVAGRRVSERHFDRLGAGLESIARGATGAGRGQRCSSCPRPRAGHSGAAGRPVR